MDYISHSSPHGNDNVGGVNVYPTPITLGEQINVIYDGLLFNSGAQEIYLHTGYGVHDRWQDVRDMKMLRTGRGWEQTFQVTEPSRINFCFRDNAGNWDNNSGHNWSFEIHDGKMY
ncbi:MAG: carbohydrate-binding protein [Firmicutes bacterium HGW-Firmicutes-14]|jgi:hypothetical protein|nr:MAG: carbohydrate-binding protein [Firmicutes bacterium HGW-Firmicutes-14]